MSECIRGSYDDALYKLTYTLLYFYSTFIVFSARIIGDGHLREFWHENIISVHLYQISSELRATTYSIRKKNRGCAERKVETETIWQMSEIIANNSLNQ